MKKIIGLWLGLVSCCILAADTTNLEQLKKQKQQKKYLVGSVLAETLLLVTTGMYFWQKEIIAKLEQEQRRVLTIVQEETAKKNIQKNYASAIKEFKLYSNTYKGFAGVCIALTCFSLKNLDFEMEKQGESWYKSYSL